MPMRAIGIGACLWWAASWATADEVRVAVASNFKSAMEAVARSFGEATGHEVIPVFGSTGKHHSQIRNGAPFEVFFAADVDHPRMLEEEGLAVPHSRFTYAVGRIVLWSPHQGLVDAEGKVLENGEFRYLAIANPELAPYGRAAREILESRSLWEALQTRMVRGENIAQTFQFVKTGNAEIGFVAFSQLLRPGDPMETGSYWQVPQNLYTPIEQQAVLLNDAPAARAFSEFVRSDNARAIIREHGYTIP